MLVLREYLIFVPIEVSTSVKVNVSFNHLKFQNCKKKSLYKVSVRASVCKICSSIDWERLAGRITEGIAMVVRRWESIPCIIRYAPKTTHDPESPGATIWSKPLTNGRNSGPPASSLPIWADKDTMRDHLFHQRIYSFSSAANANATRWNHAIGVGAVRKIF